MLPPESPEVQGLAGRFRALTHIVASLLAPRWRWALWAGGGIVAAGLIVLLFRPHPPVVPRPGAIGRFMAGTGRPVVMGFYEPLMETSPASSSFASLKANYPKIDVLAPYWFRIGWGGTLENNTSNRQVTAFAHSHRVEVWPLVGNNGYEMLTTSTGRHLTVSNLVTLARRGRYDGIVLDWELVPASQRNNYTHLVGEIGRAFHRMKKSVAVAVFPKIGVSRDVQGVYDYRALAREADAIVLMTYDHHESSTPPGPVAPMNWVSANLHDALGRIPREKLLLGVATYGYDWGPRGVETLTTTEANDLLKKLGKKALWAVGSEEPHFTYTDAGGGIHTVWFENAKTFSQKLELVKRTGTAGVAIWRLGGSERAFWKALGYPLAPQARG